MNFTFLNKARNRIVKNYIISLLIVGTITLGLVAIGYTDVRSYFVGPEDKSFEEIEEELDSIKTYVHVEGIEEAIDSGLYWEEDGKQVDNYVYLILTENTNILLVKMPHRTYNKGMKSEYSGKLQEMPSDVSYEINSMLKEEGFTSDEISELLLPVVLVLGEFEETVYVYLGVGGVCGLFILFLLIGILKQVIPSGGAAAKLFYKQGYSERVLGELQGDFDSQRIVKIGRMQASSNGIILNLHYKTIVLPMEDVLWAYKLTTKNKRYGITVSKSHLLKIATKQKIWKVGMSSVKVDQAINQISILAPWLILGYSDEIERMWNGNRTQMIELVEVKKNEPSF